MGATEPEPLLNIEQVREILGGVARTTIYVLIDKGFLTPVDLGVRRTMFRKADVQRLIRTRNEAQPDEYGMTSVTLEGGSSDRAGVIRDLQAAFKRADELLRVLSNGGEPDGR